MDNGNNNETYDKVNWIRPNVTKNGMKLSVSDRSGLVKLDIGAGRRNPALYRDEILYVIANAVELQQYLQDHDDVVMSKEARREQSKADRFKSKAGATAAESLKALGFTNEQIIEILKKQA